MRGDLHISIGNLILQRLKEKKRSIAWLALEVGRDDSNLGKTLKNSRFIHVDLLFRISIVLEEDFFAYYSQQLTDTQRR